MARTTEAKTKLRGKARIRTEIVDMSRALHKVGAVRDAGLRKTTLRMLCLLYTSRCV